MAQFAATRDGKLHSVDGTLPHRMATKNVVATFQTDDHACSVRRCRTAAVKRGLVRMPVSPRSTSPRVSSRC